MEALARVRQNGEPWVNLGVITAIVSEKAALDHRMVGITYAFRAPSSTFNGVMSSSISCLGTSDMAIPAGGSLSLPVDQKRFPGFGAELLTMAGSVVVSPVSLTDQPGR